MCYSQAMAMLWRVLYIVEQIISNEGLDFNLSKLSYRVPLYPMDPTGSCLKLNPISHSQSLRPPKTIPRGKISSSLTFKLKIKEVEENTSTSYTMSSAPRSTSKSASKFGLDDTDSMISPRSIKKELAKGQSQPKLKTMTTSAKAGSKRKEPSEPEEDNLHIEWQIHEFATERFVRLMAHKDQTLAEDEENLVDLHSISAAKDKKITQFEKEVNILEK
ncbi:hypothetical protein Hanom_Chr11g00995271 [Helianthus anomalus]